MKKIYTDEQVVGFVREAEKTEVTIAEFCRQKGFNEGTFYKWKKIWLDAGGRSQTAART
jgi:transposase-like protein